MTFEVIIHAIEGVLTLLVIGAVGYILARGKWFSPDSKLLLPKLVTVVSLPPYMIYNISNSMTRDELLHLVYGSVVPFISISLAFGASILIARLIKTGQKRRGIFCTSFTASNTVFIGIPVNIALFGEEALPYVLLYYFANTIFFWTIGNYLVASGGEGPKPKILSKATFRQIVSPPLLGLFIGVTLVLCGLKLPPFLNSAAMHLGALTTPLAIMILGIILQGMPLKSIRLDLDLLFVMFGRFIFSPLTIMLLAHFFPLPPLMYKVFVIQASLPVIASVAMLATYYKSDAEFGAVSVSATTLFSIITIPIFMVIVTYTV